MGSTIRGVKKNWSSAFLLDFRYKAWLKVATFFHSGRTVMPRSSDNGMDNEYFTWLSILLYHTKVMVWKFTKRNLSTYLTAMH